MNIHVGNLPLDVTEQELRGLFEPFGSVKSAEVITNTRTGEVLGYAFVMMGTEEEGLRAIEGLNGKPLRGKTIAVTKANRPGGKHRRPFKPRPMRRY